MKKQIMTSSKKTQSRNKEGCNTVITKKSLEQSKVKLPQPQDKLLKLYKDLIVEPPTLTKKTAERPFNFASAPKKLVRFEQIQGGVSALFQYVEKTANSDTILFDDEKPIFLQITSVKVPKTPVRILRLTVPHTLLTDTSEICLIVADKDNPKEHEETIEHYEQLLHEHGITNIKTILPFHQFKTEYGNQFETKRNLLGLYDWFLVDSKVSGYVAKLLGKIFMKKCKIPAPIKMHVPHLKTHIERSLRKTSLKLHSNGDSFSVQAGHTKMTQSDISDNISEIIDQLCNEFPGGEENIRALSIKTDQSIAVPIYLTFRNKNNVPQPVVRPKRVKHFHVTDELSTQLNKEVTVLPSGKVIVHTIGSNDSGDEEEPEEME